MQTVILCGGRGTRLREYTEAIPKVLVEVGGRPILWHIMKAYAHYGYSDFVLALGYLGDKIKQFFLEYDGWRGRDICLRLGSGASPRVLDNEAEEWSIIFADTGADTDTGGRILAVRRHVEGTFFATYGDGVSDIDISSLLSFHRSHGRLATITVVRPQVNFGIVGVDGDQVTSFREKPQLDGWINGGFFVMEPGVFDYLGPHSILEREPLENLARDGQLMAYRHDRFWACMDTYKDNVELNNTWSRGQAPWKVWER